jgi:hypothetical protein
MNFVQMPLAGSLIDVAMHSAVALANEVSVLINSDVILTQSFVEAMLTVRDHMDSWFLTGARLDLQVLPKAYEPTHEGFSDAAFRTFALNSGVLHTAGGNDYFAWNNQRLTTSPDRSASDPAASALPLGPNYVPAMQPLIQGRMPPFIRGKSKFDNWLVHEVIEAGFRDVVDGTGAVVAVHINHGCVLRETNKQTNESVGTQVFSDGLAVDIALALSRSLSPIECPLALVLVHSNTIPWRVVCGSPVPGSIATRFRRVMWCGDEPGMNVTCTFHLMLLRLC